MFNERTGVWTNDDTRASQVIWEMERHRGSRRGGLGEGSCRNTSQRQATIP